MTVLVPVYVVVGERAEVVDVAVVAVELVYVELVYVETGCSLVDVSRCTAFLAGGLCFGLRTVLDLVPGIARVAV